MCISLPQTSEGKALKDFKTTKQVEEVKAALRDFVSENTNVKVCGRGGGGGGGGRMFRSGLEGGVARLVAVVIHVGGNGGESGRWLL